MLAELTSRQVAEWLAYDSIEPLYGGARDDERWGTVVATMMNLAGVKRADRKGWRWQDVFPPPTPPEAERPAPRPARKPQSARSMRAIFAAWAGVKPKRT